MMRQYEVRDVVIQQDELHMTVDAKFTPDTETGQADGWAISYREPDDGVHRAFDDARPLDVTAPAGERGRFTAWRRVGRRLGIGIGGSPVDGV